MFFELLDFIWLLQIKSASIDNYCKNCSLGPALVFEGEEAMLAAISENPMSFKVCVSISILFIYN